MQDGTTKYIDTVQYLAKAYDFLNGKFYGNELIRPVITIQLDSRNSAYGWWTVKKVWSWKADETTVNDEYELNLSAQCLNRPLKDVFETLLHEMAHQYATKHELKDCSRTGNYHNKLYRRIAEKHGLQVGYTDKLGWAVTTLTPESEIIVNEYIENNSSELIYRAPRVRGLMVKSSNTRKYVCPICGNSCRATKQINLICADCNEYMTEEN